jgi:hypothetical protein
MAVRSRIFAAAVAAVTVLLGFPPSATAAGLTVTRAQLSGTELRVEGSGAMPRTAVVVDGGAASATADSRGRFRIEKRSFSSPTCRVDVTNGGTTAQATLSGCTPSATPAPAVGTPSLLSPSAGASVVQPVTLSWSSVTGTDTAPVVAYHWEVATSSTFGSTLLQEATLRPAIGVAPPTTDSFSGLPDGTYSWRVRAVQQQPPVGDLVNGPWSAPRSLVVSSDAPSAPSAPVFTAPADHAQYHPFETFGISWTPVDGASSYQLEFDDEPSFAVPQLTIGSGTVAGTSVSKTTGDLGTQYVRVRAIAPDGSRGTPSPARQFTISYTAPVPAAPALLAPADGTPVTLPVRFDWTPVANEQPQGYELQVSATSSFGGCDVLVMCVTRLGPSEWTELTLPAGTLYWRVRSHHGLASATTDAVTAWSPVRTIVVPAGTRSLSSLTVDVMGGSGIRSHTETYSGVTADNAPFGIVQLAGPAPAGGVVVALASSNPDVASVPGSVSVPAGEATYRFPIDPKQVLTATPVTLSATVDGQTVETPLTVLPPDLQGLEIGAGSPVVARVTGGTSIVGWLTFNGRAPEGSVIALSSDQPAAVVPASVSAGENGPTTFTIATTDVAMTTTVTITATWKGKSVTQTLTVAPAS